MMTLIQQLLPYIHLILRKPGEITITWTVKLNKEYSKYCDIRKAL